MSYSVKEVFMTLQGEGGQSGRSAVFCRFSGCNLWTGREADRAQAHCRFCDTDFVGTDGPGGGRYETAESLAQAIQACWQSRASGGPALVVMTGGEPALQLDEPLVQALKVRGFEIAIETNGTLDLPAGLDWITVSPKPGPELRLLAGTELKLVFPQDEPELAPQQFEHLAFEHFYLQPKAGDDDEKNLAATIDYCQQHPRWRLSLQTHKMIGLP